MKPSQVAQSLRQIASKIERSNKPSIVLVARDLKRVLLAIKTASRVSTKVDLVYTDNPDGGGTFEIIRDDGKKLVARYTGEGHDEIPEIVQQELVHGKTDPDLLVQAAAALYHDKQQGASGKISMDWESLVGKAQAIESGY